MHGFTANKRDLAASATLMAMCTGVSGRKAFSKVTVMNSSALQLYQKVRKANTLVNGSMARKTARGYLNGEMARNTVATGKKMK